MKTMKITFKYIIKNILSKRVHWTADTDSRNLFAIKTLSSH